MTIIPPVSVGASGRGEVRAQGDSVYLVIESGFTVSTMQAYGSIRARRLRCSAAVRAQITARRRTGPITDRSAYDTIPQILRPKATSH